MIQEFGQTESAQLDLRNDNVFRNISRAEASIASQYMIMKGVDKLKSSPEFKKMTIYTAGTQVRDRFVNDVSSEINKLGRIEVVNDLKRAYKKAGGALKSSFKQAAGALGITGATLGPAGAAIMIGVGVVSGFASLFKGKKTTLFNWWGAGVPIDFWREPDSVITAKAYGLGASGTKKDMTEYYKWRMPSKLEKQQGNYGSITHIAWEYGGFDANKVKLFPVTPGYHKDTLETLLEPVTSNYKQIAKDANKLLLDSEMKSSLTAKENYGKYTKLLSKYLSYQAIAILSYYWWLEPIPDNLMTLQLSPSELQEELIKQEIAQKKAEQAEVDKIKLALQQAGFKPQQPILQPQQPILQPQQSILQSNIGLIGLGVVGLFAAFMIFRR